jgi:DNA topoisomerase II
MANQLQLELERLSNQARFITMIVSKELVVSGRKKAEVIADLRKKDFKPFPKIAKAKAEGETEETVEDEEQDDNGVTSDFDYLLNMAISSLTKERVRITVRRHHMVES